MLTKYLEKVVKDLKYILKQTKKEKVIIALKLLNLINLLLLSYDKKSGK